MPAFDLKAYENNVLKPMYKKLPYLPDPKAFETIDWWKTQAKKRHEQLKADIADLAKRLKATYGDLGVITQAQLRLDAAAHGKLGDSELEKACTTAGLTLVEPLVLPTVPEMSAPFSTLETGLLAVGADSVVRLVHPTLTEFGLLGGLTVTPVPSMTESALSEAVLRHRATELDKLPDSTAVRAGKTAVQLLRTELKAGTDLAELTLFHLLGAVREKRAKGVGPLPLFTLLTRTCLRRADAARIAVSVVLEQISRSWPPRFSGAFRPKATLRWPPG